MSESRDYSWRTGNEFGGRADNAVQAGNIGGGVHFHTVSEAQQRVQELTADLIAVRQELAETYQELRRLRDFRAAAAAMGQVGSPPNFREAKKGYYRHNVDSLVPEIKDLVKEGPAVILQRLANPGLSLERASPGLHCYETGDVEAYLTKVRQAMVDVIHRQGL